jgi:hypothetical protein
VSAVVVGAQHTVCLAVCVLLLLLLLLLQDPAPVNQILFSLGMEDIRMVPSHELYGKVCVCV